MIDKKRGKVIESWQEKDGLPWRVVTAIDVDPKTGDVWLGPVRRRPGAGSQRRAVRPLAPAQQRAGQRRRLRRGHGERQRLGGDHGRRQPLQHDDRRVDDLHREERPDGGDLELRRRLRPRPTRSIWPSGAAASWSSTIARPDTGRSTSTPTARWRSTCTATTASIHVITTGVSPVGRGDSGSRPTSAPAATTAGTGAASTPTRPGLPSDFTNNVKARSANEAWFCTDKGARRHRGLSRPTPGCTYTRDPKTLQGKAVVSRDGKLLEDDRRRTRGVPHNFIIYADSTGTTSGSARPRGSAGASAKGYYPGLRQRPPITAGARDETGRLAECKAAGDPGGA